MLQQQNQQQLQIKIISTLKIHLSSGNSVAKDCEILVVPHNTVNLLGRDILQKLGIHLTQTKQGEKTINSINPDQQQITHKIFKISHTYAPVWENQKTT